MIDVVRVLRTCLAAFVLAGALAGSSGAGTESSTRPLLLGVYGPKDRFAAATGAGVRVGHVILGWSQGHTWGAALDRQLSANGPVPMIGLNTRRNGREVLSPLDIARGKGDGYLVALNRAVSRWGRLVYVRPLAEMNAHWNAYSAFDADGAARGASHTASAFRLAFARISLLLHGSRRTNAVLASLGLPPSQAGLRPNPPSRLRVVWNPQGYGSPDIPGNRPEAYYPGDRFVDVVGNDLYNIRGRAAWEANERLYAAHPTKPFAVPEWSNWGIDDPAFVRSMARFVLTHPRVELIAYYSGRPGSTWDLATKPRSLAAYRDAVLPLAG